MRVFRICTIHDGLGRRLTTLDTGLILMEEEPGPMYSCHWPTVSAKVSMSGQ